MWNYKSGECLKILQGHSHNVSAISFHPSLPLLASVSEDESVRIYDSSSFEVKKVSKSENGRNWALSFHSDDDSLLIGADKGFVLI